MAGSPLADLTEDELATRLRETKEELFKLRFQHATGQLSNYRRMGELKRDVARVLTRLRQLELARDEEAR